MPYKILVRRGLEENLNSDTLDVGELGFTTDTKKLVVGSDAGFIDVTDTANIKYTGTGLTAVIDVDNLSEVIQNLDAGLKIVQETNGIDTSTDLTHLQIPSGSVLSFALEQIDAGLQTHEEASNPHGTQPADIGAAPASHPHGNISATGVITTSVTIATGDKLVITDDSDGDKVKTSTVAFNPLETGKFLSQDGTFKVPTIAAGSAEWSLVGVLNNDTDGTFEISASALGEGTNFDFNNYDYKFFVELSTDAEDTSGTEITMDNVGAGSDAYSYLYHKTVMTASSVENSGPVGSPRSDAIFPGNGINAASAGGNVTHLTLDFIISRGFFQDSINPYIIQGKTSSHYASDVSQDLPTLYDGMSMSTFTASYGGQYISTINIKHDVTAGATDLNKVRVYKRSRA